MQRYKDVDGDSGVHSYEYGEEHIDVQFHNGHVYTYTYRSAGSHNIERMKVLADSGEGLNSFIMRRVKNRYAKKR
jgi:hypothetical protein